MNYLLIDCNHSNNRANWHIEQLTRKQLILCLLSLMECQEEYDILHSDPTFEKLEEVASWAGLRLELVA